MGKSGTGVVTLAARRDGDKVVIAISDDGRGVDWKAVGEAARQRGLAGEGADLTSARLLLEALKNTGRDLDRAKFLSALESLSEVETGFTPPATFTRRSHIAAPGGYTRPAALRSSE